MTAGPTTKQTKKPHTPADQSKLTARQRAVLERSQKHNSYMLPGSRRAHTLINKLIHAHDCMVTIIQDETIMTDESWLIRAGEITAMIEALYGDVGKAHFGRLKLDTSESLF